MPGPQYQQFQGYPNAVGNFFAGRDAGYGRAKENFNDQQTLETQNALVQQAGAQSYPALQAQQMQAKQMLEQYGPTLQNAIENENYEMRDALVGVLKKTGNPMLGQFATIVATAKKLDKGAYGYDITFATPEQRSAAYKADRYLQSVYPNEELIPLNTPFRVSTQGMPGTPGAHTTKFEAVSRTSAKPVLGTTTIKSEEQIVDLEEKYKDRPDILARLNHARLLFAENPAGVDVSLPEAGGVKAVKTQEKFRVDSVSTSEGLQSAVADAPPEIAKKILTEATPAIKKGYTVVLERDSKGALTGLIHSEKRPAATGGAGVGGGTGGAFPVLKYNDPGKYYGTLFKKPSGETEFATLVSRFLSASVGGRNAFQAVGLSAGKQNDGKREEFLARVSDYMASFGISQADITDAAGALSATKQLSKQQAMLEVNASVAEKGFSMLSDLRKKGQISTGAIPLLNHAENTLRKWTGDAYPSAADGVLTETLVDYAKVVSGQTSTAGVTMYAAKLAKELMELKDSPAQFQLKIDQYSQFMKARLSGGRTVLKGLSHVTDLGNKGKEAGSTGYQTPPAGYKATGQKDSTGAPLYVSPSGKIVAAPKAQ